MARSLRLLILLAVCALAPAFGQSPADPQRPQPDDGPRGKRFGNRGPGDHKPPFEGTPSPEMENVRKAIEALTPEQRKRFQENFLRWANLPPDEKKALRDREDMRRKFMEQEVEAAIKESGLTLEGDRREQFLKRYSEERRKIEEQLREQMAEKRKPLVHELLARLKEEFSAPVIPPTPTPAAAKPAAAPQ